MKMNADMEYIYIFGAGRLSESLIESIGCALLFILHAQQMRKKCWKCNMLKNMGKYLVCSTWKSICWCQRRASRATWTSTSSLPTHDNVCPRQTPGEPTCGNVKFPSLCVAWTHGCPAGVFSGSAMVKEVLLNCGGRDPATTESTAGMLRLPSWSAATTVSRYSLSCCRGSPVVRTWPFFLSTSNRPSPPVNTGKFNTRYRPVLHPRHQRVSCIPIGALEALLPFVIMTSKTNKCKFKLKCVQKSALVQKLVLTCDKTMWRSNFPAIFSAIKGEHASPPSCGCTMRVPSTARLGTETARSMLWTSVHAYRLCKCCRFHKLSKALYMLNMCQGSDGFNWTAKCTLLSRDVQNDGEGCVEIHELM